MKYVKLGNGEVIECEEEDFVVKKGKLHILNPNIEIPLNEKPLHIRVGKNRFIKMVYDGDTK